MIKGCLFATVLALAATAAEAACPKVDGRYILTITAERADAIVCTAHIRRSILRARCERPIDGFVTRIVGPISVNNRCEVSGDFDWQQGTGSVPLNLVKGLHARKVITGLGDIHDQSGDIRLFRFDRR